MIVDPYSFSSDLEVALTLEVDGKKCEIFSGHLEDIQIKLQSFGFEVHVEFSAFDNEEIKALIADPKVMNATLTIKSTKANKKGSILVEHKGIVTKRICKPGGEAVKKMPLRMYEVHFVDSAKISWGSHFTKKVFVDQTMKDVLEAEKKSVIPIKYDFEELNTAHPILAYSLEKKMGLAPESQVSFYSFLMWYLHQTNGIFDYDYKAKSYVIRGKKSEEGEALLLAEWSITPALCLFPEPPRYFERIIKNSASNQDHNDSQNPNGIESVRKDVLDDETHVRFPEQISQKVKSKLYPENPAISFSLMELEDDFDLDQFHPGTLFEIKGDKIRGGSWCEDSLFKGQTFRMTEVTIQATRTTAGAAPERRIQPYNLEIHVTAESKDETYVRRPEFQDPVYPFFTPGMVLSKVGDEEQTTFNLVKNEKHPLGHYQIIVPLAGEDKKVIAPFNPDMMSGQFYFPHPKDQQVMLAMYFQTAKIDRMLDSQPLTRQALEEQACLILFGSNGKDKYFVQKHQFKDGKNSIFIIKQSSSEKQTQTIQFQEKVVQVTVEEKDKSTLSIQLNRDSGLTVMLKDEAAGAIQTSVYTPESITHTSEGKGGTSTIIQMPESISFDCKAFNVKCEDFIVNASKTMTEKATNKIFIEAPFVHIKDKVKLGP